MSDLSDQVKEAFDASMHAREPESEVYNDGEGVSVVQQIAAVAGLNEMREYFTKRLLVATRRGYRQFAGAAMPTDSDVVVDRTTKVMMPQVVPVVLESFCCGIMVGQRNSTMVKIVLHFGLLDSLFSSEEFHKDSVQMAHGFAGDHDVLDYFNEYIGGGLKHLTHVSGFAHATGVDPHKIWDLWMLIGTATTATSYLAGYRLGEMWRLKDTLDGIEIASEEVHHGPPGEAGPDH